MPLVHPDDLEWGIIRRRTKGYVVISFLDTFRVLSVHIFLKPAMKSLEEVKKSCPSVELCKLYKA